MPQEIDWARLAAYIDSEGSIFIRIVSSKRQWHELRIVVVNTDPRLPLWCKETFGVGSVTFRKGRQNRRATLEWLVSGNVARTLLEGCLAYFVIKRDQAEIGIAFQRTKTRAYCKRGVPAAVREQRDIMLREIKRLKHIPLDHLWPN